MNTPYAKATSGVTARADIEKILRNFGCSSIGWYSEYEIHVLTLAFVWQGQQVRLKASAIGWASMYLRDNPWSSQRRATKHDYEQKALDQGMIAINSILRDWVKGQVTAIETGILSFNEVFMPFMLTKDGKTISESSDIQLLLGSDNG